MYRKAAASCRRLSCEPGRVVMCSMCHRYIGDHALCLRSGTRHADKPLGNSPKKKHAMAGGTAMACETAAGGETRRKSTQPWKCVSCLFRPQFNSSVQIVVSKCGSER